jgi:hypothetical protein
MATYIYDSEKATHLTSSTQVTTLDKGAVFTIDKTADVATVEVALDDGETVTHFIPATAVDSIAAKSIQIEAADIAALLYADTASKTKTTLGGKAVKEFLRLRKLEQKKWSGDKNLDKWREQERKHLKALEDSLTAGEDVTTDADYQKLVAAKRRRDLQKYKREQALAKSRKARALRVARKENPDAYPNEKPADDYLMRIVKHVEKQRKIKRLLAQEKKKSTNK